MAAEMFAEPANRDYYRDLGVEQKATVDQIKDAAYCLAHAKINKTRNSEEGVDAGEVRKVFEAFNFLRDEDLRARYDAEYDRVALEWAVYDLHVARLKLKERRGRATKEKEEVQRMEDFVHDCTVRQEQHEERQEKQRQDEALYRMRVAAEKKRLKEDRRLASEKKATKDEEMKAHRERRQVEKGAGEEKDEEDLEDGVDSDEDSELEEDDELPLPRRHDSLEYALQEASPSRDWKAVIAFQKDRATKAEAQEDEIHNLYSESRGLDFAAEGLKCPCWGCECRRARASKVLWEKDMGMRYWINQMKRDAKRQREDKEILHFWMLNQIAAVNEKRYKEALKAQLEWQQQLEAERKASERMEKKVASRPARVQKSEYVRQYFTSLALRRKNDALASVARERQEKVKRLQQEQDQKAAKIDLAHQHIREVQMNYLAALNNQQQIVPDGEVVLDIGFEKKRYKQAGDSSCIECHTVTGSFAWVCPSGGAIFCNDCKKKMSRFMPFSVVIHVTNGSVQEDDDDENDDDVEEDEDHSEMLGLLQEKNAEMMETLTMSG